MHSPFVDNHPQMAFVDRNEEVQALTTQASAKAFANGVCLRCPHGRSQDPNTQVRHLLVEFRRENAISIVDDELIRMIAWQRLSELLKRPLCGRMGGYIGMENASATPIP